MFVPRVIDPLLSPFKISLSLPILAYLHDPSSKSTIYFSYYQGVKFNKVELK